MGVARGLHCRYKKSVLWWENTVERDDLKDQSEDGDSIKMDPKKHDVCMQAGFFFFLGLGLAAGCCEHGNKPWVLQNPLNHIFVFRGCFLISVS